MTAEVGGGLGEPRGDAGHKRDVEDDGVGFVAFALDHLAFAVPGDEEKGAQGHTGFFRIRPERRQ